MFWRRKIDQAKTRQDDTYSSLSGRATDGDEVLKKNRQLLQQKLARIDQILEELKDGIA